jgi:hypothetical protein
MRSEELDTQVLQDHRHWFLLFYHHHCAHCVALFPSFEAAAAKAPVGCVPLWAHGTSRVAGTLESSPEAPLVMPLC